MAGAAEVFRDGRRGSAAADDRRDAADGGQIPHEAMRRLRALEAGRGRPKHQSGGRVQKGPSLLNLAPFFRYFKEKILEGGKDTLPWKGSLENGPCVALLSYEISAKGDETVKELL